MSSNISSDSGLQRERSLSRPGNTTLSETPRKVSENSTGNYPYQPLQSDVHIRLLRLKPPASSSTQDIPVISATLHEVSLSVVGETPCPPYKALSYEWRLPPSSPSDTTTILLHNYTIHIRQNLYDALRSILHNHHRLYGESLLHLWVDALCINQLDDREKGHQVQLMKTIYEAAELVIIWLGMGTEYTDRAMGVLNMEDEDLERYMHLNETKLTKEEERGIMDLYCDATYWKRVWILQEFVLARDYVVLCNLALVTKKDFEQGLRKYSFFKKKKFFYSESKSLSGWRYGGYKIWEKSSVDQIIEFRDSRLSRTFLTATLDEWLELLYEQDFKATDPRDYVFAMLGISHDGDSIVPNYALSTWEVYRLAMSPRSAREIYVPRDEDFYMNCAKLMGIGGSARGSQQMLDLRDEEILDNEDQDMSDVTSSSSVTLKL